MNDALTDLKNKIDWSIVTSTVVSAVIIGGTVYGMRKAGFSTAAKVVSGGK